MTFADYGISIDPRGGDEQRTTCPACSHERKKQNDPCLAVNVQKGTWLCHHCGHTGGLPRQGLRIEKVRPLPQTSRPKPTEDEAALEKMYAWFAGRGLARSVVDAAGVFLEKRFVPQAATERWCIGFAYRYDGEVVNVKYRDSAKNFHQSKDGTRVLYRIDEVSDATEVVICEGEIDALSFLQAGIDAVVSVPDGAPNAEAVNVATKMKFLDLSVDRLAHVENFILAVDNDPNGRRLSEELARRLGKEKCSVVNYPALPEAIDGRTHCKDANEVLTHYGVDGVCDLIASAKAYPIEGSLEPSELAGDFLNIYENGYPTIAGCGDDALDQYAKFAPGTLAVLTGVPGHGKSTYLDCVFVRHMVRNGWRVSFFTPENYPLTVHLQRLAQQLIGQPFLPNEPGRMSAADAGRALAFLEDHVAYIQPKDEMYTLETILQVAAYHVRAFGINALCIDPWNTIEHHIPKNETETIYTARVLNRIKAFARRYDIAVFIVAHPRKMEKVSMDDANHKVPSLYDISGSSNWYNIVDYGLTVYREFGPQGETISNVVYIKKVKQVFYGSIGRAEYTYHRSNQRFIPANQERRTGFANWLDSEGQKATTLAPTTANGTGSPRELDAIHNEIGYATDEKPF